MAGSGFSIKWTDAARFVSKSLCLALFACSMPVMVRAGTTGAVQGTVTDNADHPLAGVVVTAAAPSGSNRTLTGRNGFYALTGLPVDTYRVAFIKTGYESQTIVGVTVVQDQNTRLNAKLQLELKMLDRVTVRSATSLVQHTVTADTYTVSRSTLENINGTPQDPNGFQAFNALPGVTTDSGGYPIIRAGASNDVGYEYDGLDNIDAVTGQFLNGLSLNGTRSIELSTGGYDVSSGNTNSGVINQVVKRGTLPGGGQTTVRFFAPVFGHELSFEYGNALPDNRFSYYFSFGGQRTGTMYGSGTGLYPQLVSSTDFTTIDDDVVNLYYHFGREKANELQFLSDITSSQISFGTGVNRFVSPYATNNGNVQLATQLTDPSASPIPVYLSDYTTLYPGQAGLRQNIGYVDNQTFNTGIDKLNFKRQLSPSSFAEVRFFKSFENLITRYPYNTGSFTDFYQDLQTTNRGLGFDYINQISSKHQLGLGSDLTYVNSLFFSGNPSLASRHQTLEATACPGYSGLAGQGGCYIAPLNAALNAYGYSLPTDTAHAPLKAFAGDLYYTDDPVHRFNFWIKDLYQPNTRLTADVGLRFDMQTYGLPKDVALQNETYYIDDKGNYVTLPGAALGSDVTRPSQISPRVALTYTLTQRNVLRFSYGTNIEFEPEEGVEGKYRIDPALRNCTVANGCLLPLQGYSPTCVNGKDPANAGAPCNDVSNLYQQITVDENTNNFLQYASVKPQRAINVDFSIEHDFGNGLELKISPYYRKGTDYVIYSSSLLFTLPTSHKPVFGPSHASNGGVNKNLGVEFDLQRQAALGLSGFLDFTYDNTFANYDSDFFPNANNAAVAAGHFFHISYVAPVTGTLNLNYAWRNGWRLDMTMPYESGYRYGVGRKTFVFEPSGPNGSNVAVQVLNTDLASTPSQAYYFTDPANRGTIDNPNIIGSRGTNEGDDPGTLHGVPVATVNLSVSKTFGSPARPFIAGIKFTNILGNYTVATCGVPPCVSNNIYYVNNGFGIYGPGSGGNTNAGIEPYQYDYGRQPYQNAPIGAPRLFTFFLSKKY